LVSALSWPGWQDRPNSAVVHLDATAGGRSSLATLAAVADHARLEAEVGVYVAEDRASDVLAGLRTDLAGLLCVADGGVAFVESATAALDVLLGSWRLAGQGRVAVAPSEWGPNLEAFAARGLVPELLAVDGAGRLDLAALEQRFAADPPDLVHLVHVAAHRGLVQPVAEAGELCRRHGVPLWVDAAQAVGHLSSLAGANAVYGTSRKWLCGPRGVGFLGVDEGSWGELSVPRASRRPPSRSPVRALESADAHVAGRVGLTVAVREFLNAGPDRVAARLDLVGELCRELLAGVDGWRFVTAAPAGAITGMVPTNGQDVWSTRARLIADHGIVTSAVLLWRAPGELTQPALRVSPHVDCTSEDIRRLAGALAED